METPTLDPRWQTMTSPASGPMNANTRTGRVELLLDGPYPARIRIYARDDVWQYMSEAEYSRHGLPPIENRLTK